MTFSVFYQSNVLTNVYQFQKFDIYGSSIVEITGRPICYFISLNTPDIDLKQDKGKQQ